MCGQQAGGVQRLLVSVWGRVVRLRQAIVEGPVELLRLCRRLGLGMVSAGARLGRRTGVRQRLSVVAVGLGGG